MISEKLNDRATEFSLQNDELLQRLYLSEWILYPIEDQQLFPRLFLTAILSVQNAKKIWIGTFAPYNRE